MAISDENTRTLITINKEKKERLEQIAKDDGRSFSNLVNKVLDDYLNEYDDKQSAK